MVYSKIVSVVFLLAIGLLITGCDTNPKKVNSATNESITIGMEGGVLPSAVWVAKQQGFFDEVGLTVNIKLYSSGKDCMLAMFDPHQGVDISTSTLTPVMFNSFKRDDFSILASFVYSYNDTKFLIKKDSGITSATDLVGKNIGIAFGTSAQFIGDTFMLYKGIPSEDVNFIDVRPNESLEALKNNTVHGVITWEPNANNLINSLRDEIEQFPTENFHKETFNFIAMKDFIEKNPNAIDKLMIAMFKANQYININRQAAIEDSAERLNMKIEDANILWQDLNFEISLSQSILSTLEDQARWAIKSKVIDASSIPNYLYYINSDSLNRVNPESVTIITKSIDDEN